MLSLDDGKGRVRDSLLDVRASTHVQIIGPRKNAEIVQPGMILTMSWRPPFTVMDRSCALARGSWSRSRLCLLDICLDDSRMLLLQNWLAGGCGFGVTEVASARV